LVRCLVQAIGFGTVVLLALPSLVFAQESSPVAETGDFSGRVDIGGGRHLFLECRGIGGPTVVLESGFRSPETVWTDDLAQIGAKFMVLPGVAQFTRVCAYERPGVNFVVDGKVVQSRSDPVPMPRPVEDVVTDLHTLLQTAGVPGPYVLVGHSLGGLMVRLYAATYPEEVVGMVLVDAWSEQLKTILTPDQWTGYLKVIGQTPPELANDKDYETIDFAAAAQTIREATEAHPLAGIPLAVVSKTLPFGLDESSLGYDPIVLEHAWQTAQDRLATLVPGALHVPATKSSHYVQLQQPDLVIDAIQKVVDEVRSPPKLVATRSRG
jgi:pimeloyl-ACP methyl ester carboxylesterase